MDETPAAVGTAGPDAPQRAGLRANAIDLKDAVIVGMASSGPTASIALTLAAIVGVSNYGGPVAIFIRGLPMFGIALAYRRLNRWQVDCGASYTWIGRAGAHTHACAVRQLLPPSPAGELRAGQRDLGLG
jgi:hypothetical protein